jgi:S1-C subfamily serine protease
MAARNFILSAVLLVGLLLFPSASSLAGETASKEREIEQAIVFIEVTMQRGDWFSPWQQGKTTRATGSGFVIGPGLIMTNAHIVSDSKQIIVRRNGDSTPFFARVEHIGHDSDLALLRVENEAFAKGVKPLALGELPSLRTRVRTYGFPAGGEKISRTEGVVSRIQFITYLHSGADAHLGIQTDSAINPGNSGGPVLQEGKVVGVAFQTNTSLNDVGFFIPTTVIKRFLDDIKDSGYEGHGEMGIVTSNLVNPSYREYLRLPNHLTGVVVDRLVPGTSAEGHVRPGDVIVSIDEQPVGMDGTIKYHGHTLNFEQIAEEKQVNDPVRLTVWRDDALKEITFPLREFADGRRVRSNFDVLPEYVVYAGLVFMKLDQEYLRTFGNFWENARKRLIYSHFYRPLEEPEAARKETVVLTRILPHSVNSAYRRRSNSVVAKINDVAIEGLPDVVRAFEQERGPFHRIEMEGSGIMIIMDRKEAAVAHQQILKTYGIRAERRLR